MATPTIPELRAALDAATNESDRFSAMLSLARGLRYSDPRGALSLATEALELAGHLHDDRALADATRLIGRIHNHLHEYGEAREQLERALLLYEIFGDRSGCMKSMADIGVSYGGLSDFVKALEQFQAALSLVEELGDRAFVPRLTGNMALAHHMIGETARAIEEYQLALVAYEELGDRAGTAGVRGNMGHLYRELGEHSKAMECFQASLEGYEEIGDRMNAGGAIDVIASIYAELGEYAKAIEQCETALALFEEFGQRAGIATVTGNLGTLYKELHEYGMAMQHYDAALALHEELGNRGGAAIAITNIGSTYSLLGQHTRALEQLQIALAMHEELGQRRWVAIVAGKLGLLYAQKESEEHNFVVAEEYLLRAIELASDTGAREWLQESHECLATVYKEQGRWQEAHEHLTKHQQIKEELHLSEAHKKVQQFEHLKQIADIEKRRALEQAREEAQREALGLRTQLLEVQLDRQRAELAAQAMHFAKQTEMLGEFRNDLRSIMREGGDPMATVRQIKEKLKELPCEAIDWTKFDAEFRQTYPEFQSKLLQQYPELSGMELKVCALLKLKLTSQDIAKLLCLSDRSVEGHRLRIRRKMGLTQGEDVHTVLAGI